MLDKLDKCQEVSERAIWTYVLIWDEKGSMEWITDNFEGIQVFFLSSKSSFAIFCVDDRPVTWEHLHRQPFKVVTGRPTAALIASRPLLRRPTPTLMTPNLGWLTHITSLFFIFFAYPSPSPKKLQSFHTTSKNPQKLYSNKFQKTTSKFLANLHQDNLNYTPRKFNSSPLKIAVPKREVVFQPSFSRSWMLVSWPPRLVEDSGRCWVVESFFLCFALRKTWEMLKQMGHILHQLHLSYLFSFFLKSYFTS